MFHLAAYLHRLDPYALRLYGDFGIRWYGLAYAAGFVCVYILARQLARSGRIRMTPTMAGDFLLYAVIGTLVGGRLGWVVFYHPQALWTFTSQLPFWEALAIQRGGMSSHGGMIGVTLSMIIFARSQSIRILHVLDLSAIVVPFGLFFGRLANFVNGELRGKPCDPSFPLAVKFPQEITEDWTVNTFASASDLARFANMAPLRWHEMLNNAAAGNLSALRQLDDVRQQVVHAVRASNESVIAIVEPLLIARHPSQLYQAFAEGIVLGALLWFVFLVIKPRRDGIVGCCFLILYGILRIITEIWRLPDADIGITLGLSRGQWLSAAMVVTGIVALLILRRRPIAKDAGIRNGAGR